jgi:CheY-like chemotaxis protein
VTCTRIFEPFFSTKFTGRGLGLAAVKGNIRMHGGTIELEITPGKGTTFTVILPASSEAAQAQTAPDPAASWYGQGTVLVIDDEPVVRQVIQRLLTQIGFTVLTAPTGAAGIAQLESASGPVACVVLDITMPDMANSDIIQRARSIDAAIPILLMSGYSHDDVAAVLDSTARIDFLAKPFTLDTLRNSLRQLIMPERCVS